MCVCVCVYACVCVCVYICVRDMREWLVTKHDELVLLVCVQCVEKVARYIDEQNRNVFEPKGIVLGDPMDRGLRCVSYKCRLK